MLFIFAYISSSKRTKQTFKLLKKKIKIRKELFSKKLYLSDENKIFKLYKLMCFYIEEKTN